VEDGIGVRVLIVEVCDYLGILLFLEPRVIVDAAVVVDDVLDVTQTSEQLGKTAGKDTAAQKVTYPALFGIEESERKADALVSSAFSELESFGERADTLKELARYLVERKK